MSGVGVPEFTPNGDRNMKHTRLSALAAQGVSLAETIKRNTLKEEVVLEYAENFRKQFVQLYPDRQPLLLSPVNEAGCSKFVCTAIRPTQPAAKDLYDAAACASFVATYVQYEPLDPPTEVPAVLPSPELVLQQRVGDCLDLAVLLVSLLIGNGLDAYVVIGTAPKWVTLKQEDKTGCPLTVPADAVDRNAHTSLESLGLVASGKAATAGSGVKPPAASANRYKLPPPTSLESTYLASRIAKEASDKAKAAAESSFDSDGEDDVAELSRLRKGYTNVVEARAVMEAGAKEKGKKNELPDKDVHAGKRVHAWVLVRAREKGGRRIFAPFFLEPSTGTQFATDGAPYLSVEAVFNHKNYWVNMQAQSLIPLQDSSMPISPRDVLTAGPFGAGNALSDNFRAALNSRGTHVRGSGGGIAVAAVAATLDGPMASALLSEASRPDMLSPYMATLVAVKAMADKAGSAEPSLDFNFHPGAPKLAGAASVYTVANPLPPSAYTTTTAPSAALAVVPAVLPKENSNEGEGMGTGAAEGEREGEGAPTEVAAVDGEAAPDAGPGEGVEGMATAKEASATQTAERPKSGGSTGPGSKPGTAASGSRAQSRSSSRLRGTRAPSRGRGGLPHVAGSMASWRMLLGKQAMALQAQAADELAKASFARSPSVSTLSWELEDSNAWEYVLIPYETGDEEGGDGEGEGEGEGGQKQAGELTTGSDTKNGEPGDVGADAEEEEGKTASRAGSARVRSAPPVKAKPAGKYDKATIEAEGEHLLDLPASWCPRLALDRHVTKEPLGPGQSHSSTTLHFRARLDRFDTHSHPTGMTARHTAYADTGRTRVDSDTILFSRRRDCLYKRVVRPLAPHPCLEEHFLRKRAGGLACTVDALGISRSYYYYAGARVDALLLRVEHVGHKFAEWYGTTPTRLWYRSVTLVDGSPKSAPPAAPCAGEDGVPVASPPRKERAGESEPSAKGSPSPVGSPPSTALPSARAPVPVPGTGAKHVGLTVEVDVKLEAGIRKMAEKYRRNPSVPYDKDPAKVVYDVSAGTITVTYHAPPGRLTRQVRQYNRATGDMVLVENDALKPSAPHPFDTDNDFHYFLALEKVCHGAVRGGARAALELRQLREWEEAHTDLERTVYETAMERAQAGNALEEESESKTEDLTAEPDVLLPFLIAARADDPSNPNAEVARSADREARLSFKERLDGRAAAIQRKLDEEREKLLRKQQAFSRNRDHSETEETAFEEYVGEATFRIAILEQRLGRQASIKAARLHEIDAKLRADERLMAIYNPAGWKLKQEQEAADKE